jgi:hypothetical protein
MPDKFEREIDEILSKIEGFPQQPSARKRASMRLAQRFAAAQRGLAVRLSHVSVGQVVLASMLIIVFSYLFRGAFPPHVWVYGLILGLILFFTSFALSYRSNLGGRSEPYFRGQPRSYYRQDASPIIERLRAWWQQRRRGRR